MEKDIKILEEFINFYKETEKTHIDYLFSMKERDIPIQALENILKERQEDKEKINQLFAENESLEYAIGNMKHIDVIRVNYIPKSKVIEKIEWIDKEGYWEFTTDRDSDKAKELFQNLLGEER